MISAASTTPSWVSTADGVRDIATVAAAIVAGVFAYYKFARGRIFRMRCGVETSARMVSMGTEKCAIVEIEFSNVGQGPVSVYRSAEARNRVVIYELNKLMLAEARASLDDVVWEGGKDRQATLFPTVSKAKPTIVESGETFSTSVLIPLSGDTIGFRAISILQIMSRGGVARKRATYWTESIALPDEE